MKKLLCTAVTGKIYYATVKEIKPGLYLGAGKRELILDNDFIACMIEKLKIENNKIIFNTQDSKYIIKLEIEKESKDLLSTED